MAEGTRSRSSFPRPQGSLPSSAGINFGALSVPSTMGLPRSAESSMGLTGSAPVGELDGAEGVLERGRAGSEEVRSEMASLLVAQEGRLRDQQLQLENRLAAQHQHSVNQLMDQVHSVLMVVQNSLAPASRPAGVSQSGGSLPVFGSTFSQGPASLFPAGAAAVPPVCSFPATPPTILPFHGSSMATPGLAGIQPAMNYNNRIKAIFGLNALNGRVPMEDGSLGGPWSHKNAESLIRYTAKKGYTIFGWEFGNELSGNGIRARIGVDQYAADTITLKEIVDQIYVGHAIKPLIIAPGGNFEEEWYSKFIELTKDSSSLDVITHHMYILGAGVDEHLTQKILNSSYLDSVAPVFSQLRAVLQNSGTPVTAWVGEAGGAYNSGRNLVTNSFVSSFWYLDQLGMSAKYGMKSYCRQSLIGGYYALLDTTTFKPNPDYYSALLWHHLMGPKVLLTDFIGTKNIRAYCHCAKNSEGITLLLINLDKSTATDVLIREQFNGPQVTDGERKEYHLTAEDGNLNSQSMLLNGRALDVSSNGDLPALNPIRVDGSKPIKIAPLSIVFAHLPYFHALACN